jgi:hypothetical protein
MATVQATANRRTDGQPGALEPRGPARFIADPAAVGLAGFGLTTFALGMINVGALSTSALPVIFPLALAYGGIVQLLAGMWASLWSDRGRSRGGRGESLTQRLLRAARPAGAVDGAANCLDPEGGRQRREDHVRHRDPHRPRPRDGEPLRAPWLSELPARRARPRRAADGARAHRPARGDCFELPRRGRGRSGSASALPHVGDGVAVAVLGAILRDLIAPLNH